MAHGRSFVMSNLSASLTIAFFIWATWVLCSQSLICLQRSEQIAHSRSFDLSKMSKWANDQMSDEQKSKFPALISSGLRIYCMVCIRIANLWLAFESMVCIRVADLWFASGLRIYCWHQGCGFMHWGLWIYRALELYYEQVFICAGTDCLAPGRAVLWTSIRMC